MTRFRMSACNALALLTLMATALSLTPVSARAQSAGSDQATGRPFQAGTRLVALRLGNYASFGLGRFTSAKRERAWLLGVQATVSDRTGGTTSTVVGVSIGPHWRFYMRDRGPVAPFFALGVDLRGGRDSETGPFPVWNAGVAGVAGLGVSWFPAASVSVGGYTGADLSSVWTWRRSRVTLWQLSVATLTTGVSLRIYF